MKTCILIFSLVGSIASAGDSEALEVVLKSNSTAIQQALLAQKKSNNPRIGGFVDQGILEHRKLNDRLLQIRKEEKIKPKVSDLSREIDAHSRLSFKKLKSMEEPDFDRAYVESQIESHDRVIAALREILIPNSKNEVLKKNLEENLLSWEAHLNHAVTLKESMP